MKVAYVYYLITKNQLGVEKKVHQQARAIAAASLPNLDIFVLNTWKNEQFDNVRYVKLKMPPFPWNYFSFLFRRYRLIASSVDLDGYDYVILRYPLADMTGKSFVTAHNVIMEHHTDELNELSARLKLRSSFPQKIARFCLLLMERRYGGPILQNCAGLIAVTNEIRILERLRARMHPNTLTVGNGINAQDVALTGFKPFDGEELHTVFLATSFRPWHGLERIIDSFNEYQGDVRLFLHIVGDITADQLNPAERDLQNVTFHGPMTGDRLDELMRGMTLAVSSMALYKKNMQEGSTLKIREYCARGIPFMLGDIDSDLADAPEDPPFFLQLDNNSSLLDGEQILAFARKVSEKPEEISGIMRGYAVKRMDWSAKMREYVGFAEALAQRRRTQQAAESKI